MSGVPAKSSYLADVVPPAPRTELDAERVRRMLGFCITARLEQDRRNRSKWAEDLGFSRSHLTRMTNEPTGAFIAKLDLVLTQAEEPDPRGRTDVQRLRPRLGDYFAEVWPDLTVDNAQPVLEWLARYSRPWGPEDQAAHALLRSEVAIARCRMLSGTDLYRDDFVRSSVNEMCILASGPFGGSTVAIQRAAELGLLEPRIFFDIVRVHALRSPVGFRMLRVLDRYSQVWRVRDLAAPMAPKGTAETTEQLNNLLSELARRSRDGHEDPYPGAEWGATIAQDSLRMEQPGAMLLLRWLRAMVLSPDRGDRERLYAAWVQLQGFEGHRRARARIVDQLAGSSSEFLQRWIRIFGRHTAEGPLNLAALNNDARDEFADVWDAVRRSTTAHCSEKQYTNIAEALASILFAMIVTPCGRHRRRMVEGVTAAAPVRPSLSVMLDLYRSGLPSGLRECVLFAISRMRQPDDDVLTMLVDAASDREQPHVAHTALWALGDVCAHPIRPVVNHDVVSVLTNAAEARSEHETLSVARCRIAAVHALAVLNTTGQTGDALAGVEVAQRGPDSASVPTVAGRTIERLCVWGRNLPVELHAGRLADPSAFTGPI
jgi:hypothetical protein